MTRATSEMWYQCETRDGAWALMKAFDSAGITAGYPEARREFDAKHPAFGAIKHYTVAIDPSQTEKADVVYEQRSW